MASTVDIIIKATDKASAALNSTAGGLAKLKGGLNDVVSGLTGFNVGSLTAVGAVVGIGNALKQTVSDYSNYVESVDKMSMTTGMAAEETSKLIQLADDFRVEQGSLTQAMKMALQNGFEPTTENLAKLSDQYLKIQDPTQRAAEMQKIFGKAWQDMVPLLERGGDAIREASAGIDGSLVVTQSAIEQNREYVAALDNLQDTITAAGYGIAKNFIPPLTEAANALMLLVTWSDRVNAALSDHSKQVAASSDSWDAYVTEMKRSFETQGLLVRETRDGLQVLQANGRGLTDVTDKYDLLTRAEQANVKATREAAEATAANSAQAGASTVTIGNYTNAQMAAAYAQQALAVNLGNSRAQTEAADEWMKQYTQTTKDLNAAYDSLTDAQNKFNESFGDKVVGALDKAGLKGEKYEAALGLIDQKLGTTHLAQKKANDALDEAIKAYQRTGDITAFSAALETNKTQWAELDEGMKQARDGIESVRTSWINLMQNINGANGTHVQIFADIVTSGGGGGNKANTGAGGFAGQSGRHGGEAFATGGSFEIESGYPNDTYPLGPGRWASSGETVTVTPPGQNPGGGNIYATFNISGGNPEAIAAAINRKLGQMAAQSRNGGGQYAGV